MVVSYHLYGGAAAGIIAVSMFILQDNEVLVSVYFVTLLGGIAISWSSPVIPKLQNTTEDNPFDRPITTYEASLMTSVVTIGACVGCCLFGVAANIFGRRCSMITVSIPMGVGHIIMVLFPVLEVYYVARFLLGISQGAGQITTIAYFTEITTKDNRGVLMTLGGMMVSVGSLLGYCIGPWVTVTMFNLILSFVPVIATLLAIIFCLETPYFYLMKYKEDKAKWSLAAYRGEDINLDKEIGEIRDNIREQQQGTAWEVMKTKGFVKSFIIGTVLLILQQFTGINGILMYSQPIIEITGSHFSSAVCSIFLGTIFVISGAIAPFVVNRFYRRTLMNVSASGMAFILTILGIFCILNDSGVDISPVKFMPTICLCLFIFFYNFGIGPLCWIVGSEVYATRVKTIAMGFSIFTYHAFGFVIAHYFNVMVETIGIGQLFLIFAAVCLLCIVFVQLYVIETAGKTLEEIQNELNNK